MSDLPPGWEWATVGDVAETQLGKMLDKGRSTDQHLVPYLRNSNVQWGVFNLSDVLTMDIPPDQRDFYSVQAGDLLVCEGGDIGRCAIWQGSVDYIAFQKALHRVRPVDGMDVRYLRYFLEYLSGNGELLRHSSGSTIKHLPQEQLRRLRIAVPPKVEQLRIVAALEDHLSRINAGISYINAARERHARSRDSIWMAALRGLFAIETSDDISASELLSGLSCIRRDKVSRRRLTPISMAQPPELDLPNRWTIASLDSLCWDIQYGTSAKSTADEAGNVIPVIRMGNIQNGRLVSNSLKYLPVEHPDVSGLRLIDGDVLFNRTNSLELVGKAAVYRDNFGPATFASYLIRCRLLPQVNPDWISLVINSPFGRKYVKSVAVQQVGQANVNGTKLGAMPIPLPPPREQEQIVATVRELLDRLDRVAAAADTVLAQGDQLCRALLADAFAGRLVAQDPSDEPASAILDRVRAERSAQPKSRRTRRKDANQETLL
ncbi:restriction endonuclease subunit S [Nocardia niigatensis]